MADEGWWMLITRRVIGGIMLGITMGCSVVIYNLKRIIYLLC